MVALAEYLNTSYDPEVEYVDGVLVERSVGEWPHSLTQSNIILALAKKYRHIRAVPSVRVQTRSTRFRVPDVCPVLSPPTTRYLLDAPHIVAEILSDNDCLSPLLEKLEEYAAKGVPNIWLLDPRLQHMSTYRHGSLTLVRGDRLSTSDGIELTREEAFQQ